MTDKIIAFGDIHGVLLATKAAITLAEELGAKAIFLGDYVDRGKESMEVIELLIEAKAKHPDWIFLMGNHDFMLLNLINGISDPEGYDEKTKNDSFEKWNQLEPLRKDRIVEFIANLTYFYETPNYLFLHAVLKDSQIPIASKEPLDLIWNYDHEPIWEGKTFIHGHYPVDEAQYKGKGININTSCGYGWGFLTTCLIENSETSDLKFYKISKFGELM
jgi:serine/threonine protein phosphatase 1